MKKACVEMHGLFFCCTPLRGGTKFFAACRRASLLFFVLFATPLGQAGRNAAAPCTPAHTGLHPVPPLGYGPRLGYLFPTSLRSGRKQIESRGETTVLTVGEGRLSVACCEKKAGAQKVSGNRKGRGGKRAALWASRWAQQSARGVGETRRITCKVRRSAVTIKCKQVNPAESSILSGQRQNKLEGRKKQRR